MDSSKLDNKMKLLAGKAIYVDGIPIKPMKIGEIVEIGFTQFQQTIQIMMLSLDDMINSIEDFESQAILKMNKHQYKVFDLYMISDALRDMLIVGFKMVFRTDNVVFIEDIERGYVIIIDEKYEIDRDNYDEIVKVLTMQNNPSVSESTEEEDYNPADELANGIAEKLRRAKELVKNSKPSDDNDGIGIDDVISSVTALSNSVNKLNILEYTLYQLYDEFARLIKIDNYKFQMQASMWSSDMEIAHWSEPL